MGRDLILFILRLALPGLAMELPIVPGTDDIVAVKGALTQWTTGMVTGSRDHPEFAAFVAERELDSAADDFLQWLPLEFVQASYFNPVGFWHAGLLQAPDRAIPSTVTIASLQGRRRRSRRTRGDELVHTSGYTLPCMLAPAAPSRKDACPASCCSIQ